MGEEARAAQRSTRLLLRHSYSAMKTELNTPSKAAMKYQRLRASSSNRAKNSGTANGVYPDQVAQQQLVSKKYLAGAAAGRLRGESRSVLDLLKKKRDGPAVLTKH